MTDDDKTELPDEDERLREKIAMARASGIGNPTKAELERLKAKEEDATDMQLGIRAGTEMVVSVLSGSLIGYGLDYWLETKPIFFMIFIFTGIGVGFLNIYKITQKIGTGVGFAELHKRKKQGK
ncbi:MAG: AtpZ/AtpI family protein [Pseudobdellovibrionaceae bacterium]